VNLGIAEGDNGTGRYGLRVVETPDDVRAEKS
jgi:hypothetical protein